MTRIAITRSRPRPAVASWNACAVPWNFVVTPSGSIPCATSFTSFTAWPRETPGLRLKEIVTAGSGPRWQRVRGQRDRFILDTAHSGTDPHENERTRDTE